MFKLMSCKKYDDYPGYPQFEEPIGIPSWSIREELGDEDPLEGEDDE